VHDDVSFLLTRQSEASGRSMPDCGTGLEKYRSLLPVRVIGGFPKARKAFLGLVQMWGRQCLLYSY